MATQDKTPEAQEEEMDAENNNPSELTNGTELEHSPVAGPDLPNEVELEQLRTKGWTLATCQSLTFGEICLMLDLPEKLILEYDFVAADSVPKNSDSEKEVETEKDKGKVSSSWLSQVLARLVSVSGTCLADFKGKQGTNVSPMHRTSRGGQSSVPTASGATVGSAAQGVNSQGSNSIMMTPPSSKAGRRVPMRFQRQGCAPNSKTSLVNGFVDDSTTVHQQQQMDEHVFVMPIGAAPRGANKTVTSAIESVKDQLDRLVPGNRRLQRGVRHRKPLVVQRPLLPRQGQGSSTATSMIALHLVQSPSSPSARTLVLPSTTNTTVQISTAGSCSASSSSLGFVSQSAVGTGLSTAELPVVMAAAPAPSPAGSSSLVTESPGLVRLSADASPAAATSLVTAGSLHTPIKISGLGMLEGTVSTSTLHGQSPPVQISIPEPPTTAHLPSILDITLEQTGLSDVSQAAPTSTLLDFGDNSNSSLAGAFGLSSMSGQHSLTDPLVSAARQILVQTSGGTAPAVVTSTTVTPPHSPNSRFKVSSPGPENQWLNGEGGEFSLSSLLGTLDSSPLKQPSNPSHQAATNNNNSMDSTSCLEARLGSEVENHLHCLINENSVDYVAKFADLAAQISSTENKCV